METTREKLTRLIFRSAGEVLLIFIGVTIAFWFDSWKKEREERAFEKEILTALRLDLEQTIAAWTIHQREDVRGRYLNDLIRSLELSRMPDSLSEKMNYISQPGPHYPLSTAYETLKSKGFDLVQDTQLRTMISFLFSDTYAGWLQGVNARELEFRSEFDAFSHRWFVLGEGDIIYRSDVYTPYPSSQQATHEFHQASFRIVDLAQFVSSKEVRNILERKRQMIHEMNSVLSVAIERTNALIHALKEKGY